MLFDCRMEKFHFPSLSEGESEKKISILNDIIVFIYSSFNLVKFLLKFN